MSLCSSRGTAGLDSRGSGVLGRVLSVPYQHITCSSRKPLSCTHSCGAEGGLWGTQPQLWGAAAAVGTAGKPEGERGCSALEAEHPGTCNSWIPVFYPVMSLPQDNLPLGGVCLHKELILPQSRCECVKFLHFFFFFNWEITGLFHEGEARSALLEGARS